jgi:parallel beta-helix repeat protein
MLKKSRRYLFLFFLFVNGCFVLLSSSGTVKASTNVPSIISADTVWTKAGSPYEVLGSVLVSNDVVLTIEPGVVVNMNDHQVDVNGTLRAMGTSSDLIEFNGAGRIQFLVNSTEWDEQTGLGCIFEHVNLRNTFVIADVGLKVYNCLVRDIYATGSAVFSGNTIFQSIDVSGSAVVEHNSIVSTTGALRVSGGSPIISHNNVSCRVKVERGSPTIYHNTLADGIHVYNNNGEPKIVGNIIKSARNDRVVHVEDFKVVLIDNTITGTGEQVGITFEDNRGASVVNNTITNCETAIDASFRGPLTIEKNTITNNQNGVHVQFVPSLFGWFFEDIPSVTVRYNAITNNQQTAVYVSHNATTIINNTITNNGIGIEVEGLQAKLITQNNIYDNQYNLKVSTSDNVNVANNYWGTTDLQAINQTIYDKKYDYKTGTASFVPFLPEINTYIPEFPTHVILPLLVTAAFIATIYKKQLNKKQ